MSDLIRREDAIKQIEYHQNHKIINKIKTKYALEMVKSSIEELPTAKPKVGKWERKPYKRQGHEEVVIEGCSWRCSNCGDARKRNEPDMNFCPNCGTKMERKANE